MLEDNQTMSTTTEVQPILSHVGAFSITYKDKKLTTPQDRDQMEITDGASYISDGKIDIYVGYVIVTHKDTEYEILLEEIETITSLDDEILFP